MTDHDALTWRPATEADTDEIATLESTLFGDTAWPAHLVRDELTAPYRRYTVIEDGERIVGYGGVLVVGSDGDVQTIAITPDMRGAGLGRALLDDLLSHADALGATQVFLEVRADNPVAISLYERAHFERIGERKQYYQPGNVDAIIMRRNLRTHPPQEER